MRTQYTPIRPLVAVAHDKLGCKLTIHSTRYITASIGRTSPRNNKRGQGTDKT